MKKLILAAAGALGLASASLTALPAAAQPARLIETDFACGPGWHLNYWDRCVPNYRFYGPSFVIGFRDRGRFRDRDDFRFRGHAFRDHDFRGDHFRR